MRSGDTIVAISSSISAPAARIIVRMSGPNARGIAAAVIDSLPAPSEAGRTPLTFGGFTIPAWVYFFGSPRSYTGEDLIEFHIPGNPLLTRILLEALVIFGARYAEPGEFTARAYFSGRIDLAEAEGVAATISAHGEAELRAARQLMAGELSSRLRRPMDLLADTLALVEAGIDFSDEDVSFISSDELARRIDEIDASLSDLVENSARLEPLTHEPSFVLVGRPNAGKSTLLNALAGRDRAIVSPVAGTTRDALSVEVRLGRGLVRVIDVAGLDESGTADGAVERQMGARAHRAIESADFVLLVRDVTDTRPQFPLPRDAEATILTKADLSPTTDAAISAMTGAGLDDLRERLDAIAFGRTAPSGTLVLNARHLAALGEARASLARSRDLAGGASELVALELRDTLDHLGRILGVITPDDVLGRVFATFCIGK